MESLILWAFWTRYTIANSGKRGINFCCKSVATVANLLQEKRALIWFALVYIITHLGIKKVGIAPHLFASRPLCSVLILYHRFAPQTGHFPALADTLLPQLGHVTVADLPPVEGFFPLLLKTFAYAL